MDKDLERIRKKLGHLTLEWKPSEYLDTGDPNLNAVFGHQEKGLMYGRFIELAGWESQGKSLVGLTLAALAQAQGALVIWADFENSWDEVWARQRGLDPEKVTVIQPYVGKFDKESDERLSSAQELCTEIESTILAKRKKFDKIMLVIDSIPMMLTEEEAEAGIEGQNMRTGLSLPVFLAKLLRRWVGMAQVYNVMVFCINQLRSRPDPYRPEYTPAGNTMRFVCHVRAQISRRKGGYIKDRGGQTVGIQGVIENYKNKSGSPERAKIGFKARYSGAVEFLDAKRLEKAD